MSETPGTLLAAAQALLPAMVDVRRRMHRHPEIGLDLPRTQSLVVDRLRQLGLEPRLGRSLTSVVAEVAGAAPGPTLVLRADMDALPLGEATGLEFASEVEGAMHACGHDLHVAMLLGAAELLAARRDRLAGRVRLAFQPGEEGCYGARAMRDEGLLDGLDAASGDAAFALHVFTSLPTGSVHLRPGPVMAAMDTLRLVIRGRGGHASAQFRAVNPTPIAAQVILALEGVTVRRVDPVEPAIVTISSVVSGTAPSVIPASAALQGTMRTVDDATRAMLKAQVRGLVEGICAMNGAVAELEIEDGYPATVNDAPFTSLVEGRAADLLGAGTVVRMPAPLMAAEDFSYLLERLPGAMALLGARPPDADPATAPNNHSDRAVFDEAAMAPGAALLAAVALRHLAPGG